MKFIISEINNANKYIEKIKILLDNPSKYLEIRRNALNTASHFDIDNVVEKYIEYFKQVKINEYNLTEIEKEEIKKWQVPEKNIFNIKNTKLYKPKSSFKHKLWINFLRIFPKKFKSKIKMKIRNIVNR